MNPSEWVISVPIIHTLSLRSEAGLQWLLQSWSPPLETAVKGGRREWVLLALCWGMIRGHKQSLHSGRGCVQSYTCVDGLVTYGGHLHVLVMSELVLQLLILLKEMFTPFFDLNEHGLPIWKNIFSCLFLFIGSPFTGPDVDQLLLVKSLMFRMTTKTTTTKLNIDLSQEKQRAENFLPIAVPSDFFSKVCFTQDVLSENFTFLKCC